VSEHETTRGRFAATADQIAARQAERAEALAARVSDFVPLSGDERALDAGTGTGALAYALAPLVREVVGVDVVPELLDQARAHAPENATFADGDITALGFGRASFDLAATLRTLHHVARPELGVAELARVTRPGGTVLVIDQVAPIDPLAALELDRFERARDPTHTRTLPDADFRQLFEANGLVLLRAEFVPETREIDPYLDLAGCEGEAREHARALAPRDYGVTIGWYLLRRP
jgi:SAM-dependent methyltransferase